MSADGDLRFGLSTPEDWLAKAHREFKRLRESAPSDKIDHAINLAITIAQTADWIFNAALERTLVGKSERNSFLDSARKASTDTAILTDISNTSKHFTLDRKPASSALSVSEGHVVIPREFLFSRFVDPKDEPFSGHVKAIRTIIDEDEIVGFDYAVGEHRVLTDEGYQSFEVTCDQALAFWEDALKQVARDQRPSWFTKP